VSDRRHPIITIARLVTTQRKIATRNTGSINVPSRKRLHLSLHDTAETSSRDRANPNRLTCRIAPSALQPVPIVLRGQHPMQHQLSDESVAVTPATSSSVTDSSAHLQPHMRVLGTHGKLLGKVETLEHDAATGQLTTLVIRHGLLNNKRTAVPASRVKWVNVNSVILDLTPTAFKLLPRSATT
jgi:sporulation protein YlmC with PRC-barrel domain